MTILWRTKPSEIHIYTRNWWSLWVLMRRGQSSLGPSGILMMFRMDGLQIALVCLCTYFHTEAFSVKFVIASQQKARSHQIDSSQKHKNRTHIDFHSARTRPEGSGARRGKPRPSTTFQ